MTSVSNLASQRVLSQNLDLTAHTLSYLQPSEMRMVSITSKFIHHCCRVAYKEQFFERKKLSIGQIVDFKKRFGHKTLTHFLSRIPQALKNGLTDLDLGVHPRNELSELSEPVLSELIPAFPNLTRLRLPNGGEYALHIIALCSSKIRNLDLNIEYPEQLTHAAQVSVLDKILEKFPIQETLQVASEDPIVLPEIPENAQIIAASDKYKDHLTQVKIAAALQSEEPLIHLFEVCEKLQSVTLLRCTRRLLGEIGLHCPNLTKLDLELNPDDHSDYNSEISSLVGRCLHLTDVTLRSAEEEDEGIQDLFKETCESIASCTNLQSLNLINVDLSAKGLVIIAQKCSKLTHLTLSVNTFRDGDIYPSARYLKELTSIDLGTSKVSEKGALALLLTCRKLQSFESEFSSRLQSNEHVKLVKQMIHSTNLDRQLMKRDWDFRPATSLGREYATAFRGVMSYLFKADLSTIKDRDLFLHFDLFYSKVVSLATLKKLVFSKYASLSENQCKYVHDKMKIKPAGVALLTYFSTIISLRDEFPDISPISKFELLNQLNFSVFADAIFLAEKQEEKMSKQ